MSEQLPCSVQTRIINFTSDWLFHHYWGINQQCVGCGMGVQIPWSSAQAKWQLASIVGYQWCRYSQCSSCNLPPHASNWNQHTTCSYYWAGDYNIHSELFFKSVCCICKGHITKKKLCKSMPLIFLPSDVNWDSQQKAWRFQGNSLI